MSFLGPQKIIYNRGLSLSFSLFLENHVEDSYFHFCCARHLHLFFILLFLFVQLKIELVSPIYVSKLLTVYIYDEVFEFCDIKNIT